VADLALRTLGETVELVAGQRLTLPVGVVDELENAAGHVVQ
jgi:hypothetical protein